MTRPGKSEFSKSDVRYWKPRVFKRSNDDWQAQIGYQGDQERFPLGTPSKDAAAAKARDIYLCLITEGWEKTRALYKPWTVRPVSAVPSTVGEFLTQVRATSHVKPITLETYAKKFRRLVAGVMVINGDKKRFDYVHGGSAQWRERVDKVQLAELTPTRIQTWKVEFLKQTASNPLQNKQAQATVASVLRSAKSLFQPTILKHLTLELPTPLPFDGIEIGRTLNHRYKSRINAPLLLHQAREELETERLELYKVFLLALGAGLRRDEIDTLTWKQIDWSRGLIRIETTAYTATKTAASEEEVDIDAELLAILKRCFGQSKSEFVITSAVEPRPALSYHHYRCNKIFRQLNEWLRSKGVTARNPTHCLRKEFGSLICHQAGIFAASAALRHSNITLTRDYYVDKKARIELPIGEMLKALA